MTHEEIEGILQAHSGPKVTYVYDRDHQSLSFMVEGDPETAVFITHSKRQLRDRKYMDRVDDMLRRELLWFLNDHK